MQKIKKYIPLILALSPVLASAATLPEIIATVHGMFRALVPLFIALALVVFIWGVIKYITAGGDEEKRTAGRNTMIWGIVGLFVIVAAWGLVYLIADTFEIDVGGNVGIPIAP